MQASPAVLSKRSLKKSELFRGKGRTYYYFPNMNLRLPVQHQGNYGLVYKMVI